MSAHRAGVIGMAGLAAAIAAAFLVPRGRPRPRPGVVADLVAQAAVADHESPLDLTLFGTPRAEPRQVRGFFREGPAEGDPFAWVRRQAEVAMRWPEMAGRAALLDLAPYPGLTDQAVSVALNGRPLGRLEVAPGRHRYRLSLPREAQRSGVNTLTFEFERVAPEGNRHRRRLAAAFYGLLVGAEDDPALGDLLARDAPPALSTGESGGNAALTQAGPSVLRYALRLPEAAELRFAPDLHPTARAAGGAADVRVTIQERSGPERELWRGQVSGAGASEVALPLPGLPGDIVRLGLHVGKETPGRFQWVVWKAPRILGHAPAAPAAGPEPSRLEALRQSLRGASVLLIVLDAAGARHLSAYGYPRPTTPEIDRLAAEGVLFERAYTPAVFTLAAMSSMWTSQYPDEHHGGVSYDAPLPGQALTLAELLGANGIYPAGFVANGMAGPSFGLERGFAEFREVYRDLGHRASAFLQALPPWLEANKERRFFLYAHFREPHFPYDPEPPFDARFGTGGPLTLAQRRTAVWYTAVNAGKEPATPEAIDHLVRLYDGNLAYADSVVGRLRRTLEEKGLWDRTIVIVTADHGEALYEHGFISHGEQVYEESAWIPLVVRLPSRAGLAGVRVRALTDLVDVAPTVADMFGVLDRGNAHTSFHGRSLLPAFLGGPTRPCVVSRSTGQQAKYALRDPRYRFIYNTRYGQEELYDLEKDPGEQQDVVATEAVLASYYRQLLHEWLLAHTGGGGGDEPGSRAPTLDKDALENLKALGYLN